MPVSLPDADRSRPWLLVVVGAGLAGVVASVVSGVGVWRSGPHPAVDLPIAVTVGGLLVSVLGAAVAALLINGRTWTAHQVSEATAESRVAADQVRGETTDLQTANHSLGLARDAAATQLQAKSEFLSR